MFLLLRPADKELGTSVFNMGPQLQGSHVKLPLEVSYYCFSSLSRLAGEGLEVLKPQWTWTREQRARLRFTQGRLPMSANDSSKQSVLLV